MKKLVMSLVVAAVGLLAAAEAQAAIDGIIDPGGTDPYVYLGTSVTTWGGGTSVDVYGYADATDLYVAYEADTTTAGWSTAVSMGVGANFSFKTPTTISWPDPGYTLIGTSDGYGRTDGSGWIFPDGWGNVDWVGRNMEGFHGHPMWGPFPGNVAEFRIPLSELTYAGTDGRVQLGGQYWQYAYAQPFYVNLPGSPIPEPASLIIWSLLGAGCAGLGVWRRRRAAQMGGGTPRAPWSEESRQAIRQIIDHGRTNA